MERQEESILEDILSLRGIGEGLKQKHSTIVKKSITKFQQNNN
jgi:hypothetical protein